MNPSRARAQQTERERRARLAAELKLTGYITATAAAELAHCSPSQIGYLCERGVLEAVRVKHYVFVKRADVVEWMTPRPYLDNRTGDVTSRYIKPGRQAGKGEHNGHRGAR